VPTLAIKPFSSGDRHDAELLKTLQQGDLRLEEVNPFFFRAPLAPFVAARKTRRDIDLGEVLEYVCSIQERFRQPKITSRQGRMETPILLIEGVGGLLVPLGRNFSVLDLINALQCEVLVVSRNQLGTLNHTLLTIRALQNPRRKISSGACAVGKCKRRFERVGRAQHAVKLVLLDQEFPDESASSNAEILRELVAPIRVHKLPFFIGNCLFVKAIEQVEKKIEKTLAQILR
jgi:dethiobiotin synthase